MRAWLPPQDLQCRRSWCCAPARHTRTRTRAPTYPPAQVLLTRLPIVSFHFLVRRAPPRSLAESSLERDARPVTCSAPTKKSGGSQPFYLLAAERTTTAGGGGATSA